MKNLIFLLLIAVSQSYSAPDNSSGKNDPVVIIKNITIYTGDKYIENTNLVYQHGVIIDISKSIESIPDALVIDGDNKTIIPPLINAHAHITSGSNLKESLKHGIFANLDMHTTDDYANSLRIYNDSSLYASYYSSNVGANVPGGHGTQFGIAVPTITDSITPQKFVSDRVNAGADYIKILKEPLMATLSSTQTLEIINEAHKHEKLAVAHIARIKDAVELGNQHIDGFVHIWWDEPATETQLYALKESNAFLIPTITATNKLIEFIESGNFRLFKKDAPFLSKEKLRREIQKAYNIGIPILCGTDAPNFQMNYTDQIYKEMLELSKAGLSNKDVINSATTNIYDAFDLDEFKGGIKVGGKASFIIVDGNPILNIEDINNPKMVIKNGLQMN